MFCKESGRLLSLVSPPLAQHACDLPSPLCLHQLASAKALRLLSEEVATAVREERPRTEALFLRLREAKDKHAAADNALVLEIKVGDRLDALKNSWPVSQEQAHPNGQWDGAG